MAVLADPNLEPTTRKRYSNAFEHFGKHFGAQTKLHEIPQEKFAGYADAVPVHSTWSVRTKGIYISTSQRLFGFYEARNRAVPRIARGKLVVGARSEVLRQVPGSASCCQKIDG